MPRFRRFARRSCSRVGADVGIPGALPPALVHAQPLKDLLHPTAADTKKTHKLKRLVQAPNSCFIDVRCNQCLALYVRATRAARGALLPWVLCFGRVWWFWVRLWLTGTLWAACVVCYRTTMFSHAQTVVTCTG